MLRFDPLGITGAPNNAQFVHSFARGCSLAVKLTFKAHGSLYRPLIFTALPGSAPTLLFAASIGRTGHPIAAPLMPESGGQGEEQRYLVWPGVLLSLLGYPFCKRFRPANSSALPGSAPTLLLDTSIQCSGHPSDPTVLSALSAPAAALAVQASDEQQRYLPFCLRCNINLSVECAQTGDCAASLLPASNSLEFCVCAVTVVAQALAAVNGAGCQSFCCHY